MAKNFADVGDGNTTVAHIAAEAVAEVMVPHIGQQRVFFHQLQPFWAACFEFAPATFDVIAAHGPAVIGKNNQHAKIIVPGGVTSLFNKARSAPEQLTPC